MPTPDHHNALHPITLNVGGITVEGFSISGLATWVIVPELDVMFDAGECPLSAVPIKNVFLTHVHGDHSRCLLRHWQLRRMFNLDEATYHVPSGAVSGFKKIVRAEAEMEGVAEAVIEHPTFRVVPTDRTHVPLPRAGTWVKSFPVTHRVESQGYTVGRTVRKLRPEFAHLPGEEIGKMRQAGQVVTDTIDTPIVTFIGDCIGASLTEQSHIWDSKIVIIECTYVEDDDVDAAIRNTHTHLREIVDVLARTPAPACEALVLKHFSMKCDPKRVRELVAAAIPPEWASRVHVFLP